MRHFLCLLLIVAVTGLAVGQDSSSPETPTTIPATDDSKPETSDATDQVKPAPTATTEQLKKSAEEIQSKTKEEIEKIAVQVDKDPRAATAAAGILQPIYLIAESLAFPAFHWLAFALMTAGVISYALQLVLGKFVVLASRFGFSLREIVSDAIGLAISITGLVLTTQAAAENSTFTHSPAAVISATAVGVIVGIILYRWGQTQELEAATGRTTETVKKR